MNNPDLTIEEQKIFKSYYDCRNQIESITGGKKKAYHDISADYLRNCFTMNLLAATVSCMIYHASWVYIRPNYPHFGNIIVTSIFGIQFFNIHNYIFERVPSKDIMYKKLLITGFVTILFGGRLMEVFSVANYQRDYLFVLLPILCAIVAKFIVEFINDTKPIVWLRDVMFVIFFQPETKPHKH